MADVERIPNERHVDPDRFVGDRDGVEDGPNRWSLFRRSRLGRPSMPVLAAACVGVLVVLAGVVVGGQAKDRQTPPPANGAGQTEDAPVIDFVPVGDEAEVASPDSPQPTHSPSATPGASGGPGTTGAAPTPTAALPQASRSQSVPVPQNTPGTGSSSGTTPASPKVTFTEVGGYHCSATATRGFRHSGWYKDGKEGWYAVGSGGWASNGCEGHYAAMPMSGAKSKDDSGVYGEWWFAVGTASRTCAISTYVPTTTDDRNVAGNPATYQVRDTEGGPVRATYTINQRTNRGRWVASGTYAVTGGRIVIRSVNRGIDWDDSGPTLEHIAVAQIRVTCQ
ncbi:hypothetical protein GCM10027290_15600 [Micromonospora sonneratiae]|uniref:Adhesin n=1 Tax=Micromonospora sonneratiae TaxID=1184706 RepID=A0ABW3YCB2_9ACTN